MRPTDRARRLAELVGRDNGPARVGDFPVLFQETEAQADAMNWSQQTECKHIAETNEPHKALPESRVLTDTLLRGRRDGAQRLATAPSSDFSPVASRANWAFGSFEQVSRSAAVFRVPPGEQRHALLELSRAPRDLCHVMDRRAM